MKKNAMSIDATELELYIENTAELYPKKVSIIKNLMRKIENDSYDFDKSIKLWEYLVIDGAKMYLREFDSPKTRVQDVFPKSLRREVATGMAESFIAEAELGNFDEWRKMGKKAQQENTPNQENTPKREKKRIHDPSKSECKRDKKDQVEEDACLEKAEYTGKKAQREAYSIVELIKNDPTVLKSIQGLIDRWGYDDVLLADSIQETLGYVTKPEFMDVVSDTNIDWMSVTDDIKSGIADAVAETSCMDDGFKKNIMGQNQLAGAQFFVVNKNTNAQVSGPFDTEEKANDDMNKKISDEEFELDNWTAHPYQVVDSAYLTSNAYKQAAAVPTKDEIEALAEELFLIDQMIDNVWPKLHALQNASYDEADKAAIQNVMSMIHNGQIEAAATELQRMSIWGGVDEE